MTRFFRFLVFTMAAVMRVAAAQAGQPEAGTSGNVYTITSPDGYYTFSCYQKQTRDTASALYYTLSYRNVPVIYESLMELQLDNHLSEQAMALKVDRRQHWFDNLLITGIDSSTVSSSWEPVYGEQHEIRDHYRALTVHMVKDDNPIYKMDLQVRLYNEGAAFRFFFPENEKGTYYRVTGEHTEFTWPAGTRAWHHSWAQAPYQLMPLAGWPDETERPLTLELPNGWYACLAEAQMVDYARTRFKLGSKPNTIITAMYTPADLISPFATPWRVIMIAEEAGKLIQNNALLLNLNKPSEIKDPDWIKPGKIMRVMTQTTKDAFENIDFAAQQGLQYILFDWKWYGPAFSFASDATRVAIPDFDLPAIIKYGRDKGIGVWLYVNQQALLAQSDSLFRVYHSWGIKGVKFGFVQVGSHRWTTWIEEMFRKAAENRIMVNVHDDWRPTGEQRTWPNLMTAEGIRGNEEMPDATHNTILPFTRFLAGAADYTICYYDQRIKTTHAHQLALAAIYYSPIQTLFWYDKPAMSTNEPELEFWKAIPTTWDETKVLQGKPGAFITTARRSGTSWFIGTITNNDARQLKIDFSFLPRNRKYQAAIYSDDDTVPTKTKVRIRKTVITSDTVLDVRLKPSGGQAIWLTQQ
ncbi:glycoside hydrolase family 97 protein [Niabella drilacis]|uniref:Alpha-glucosidase n=1 Tax=Niabella drilacis (strain DSM 25811 / CCM 8410 / CCUG 62505 / LMG 26954 / E90) TaxID=1285928 RepID=A0A1G6S5D4_NIADE|nr:glycoside hydrolase family 97 protein [Niabella drilacis]SDD12059.1 alpha-glucosidase [Niabella drilacis]